MVAMVRAGAVIVSLVGACWAGFIMLMGPLISEPPPEGAYLLAVLGYPLFLVVSGFVVAVSIRAGLVCGLLALLCLVVVRPYASGESLADIMEFGWWIGWPAVCFVVLAGLALCGRARWE